MANKDFKEVFAALKGQGWRVIVCFASSSGDTRALRNTIRDLKASGLQWPWKPPKGEPGSNEVPDIVVPNVTGGFDA